MPSARTIFALLGAARELAKRTVAAQTDAVLATPPRTGSLQRSAAPWPTQQPRPSATPQATPAAQQPPSDAPRAPPPPPSQHQPQSREPPTESGAWSTQQYAASRCAGEPELADDRGTTARAMDEPREPSPSNAPPRFDPDEVPLAPDGTPVEMRVLHDGKAASESRPDSADALKRLDASFEAYFGDAAQGESKAPEAEKSAGPSSGPPNGVQASDSAEGLTRPERAEASASEAASASSSHVAETSSMNDFEHSSAEQTSPPAHVAAREAPSSSQASAADPTPDATTPTPSELAQQGAATSDAQVPEAVAEVEEYDATTAPRATPLRAAKVPSSRIARALHYGGLGAGLAWGAAGSFFSGSSRGESGKEGSSSPILGDSNVRRLVDKLSTMRGAALKLGQFLSIQDSNMLPPQLEEVLLRVQNSAHYMPAWQMERVMHAELGPDWRKQFASFSDVPFASASIGQVHAAVLAEDHPSPLAGQRVAIKIQFPGVRSSIASDLGNLRWLLAASALLPKGLFLDNTIRVMQRELDDECDYLREADMIRRFGELTKDSQVFAVPRVVDELSTAQVLTTEMMRGRPLTQAARYTQDKRDQIAKSILELSLRELFEYRLMQTDPNWTNFLYNERTGKIELIDFGAARAYDKPFIDDWLCMLRAAIGGRRDECVAWSEKVGYLTGRESEAMRDAHVDSMIALGEPFRADAPNPYPFAEQTITARVRAQIPLMLRERLTPPPEQTYSLNRKLSGAFLLCARLGARVSCNTMLSDVTRDYVLENTPPAGVPQRGNSASSFGSDRRGLHTSRILREVEQAGGWRRQQRTRSSVNLADRWPRHIVEAVQLGSAAEAEDAFATLAPNSNPAAPSIGDTLAAPDSRQTLSAAPLPAQQPSKAEDPRTVEAPKTPQLAIRGVRIPSRPPPPGPEDCCMSGCAHCAYDIYADDLQDFHAEAVAARAALLALDPPLAPGEWPAEQLGAMPSPSTGDKATGMPSEQARATAESEVDAVIGGLDPTMRAFIEMERRTKKKKAAAGTAASPAAGSP